MRELAALRLVNRDGVSQFEIFFDALGQLVAFVVGNVLAIADSDARLSCKLHGEAPQPGSVARFDSAPEFAAFKAEGLHHADLAVEDLDLQLLSRRRVVAPDRVRLRPIANLNDLVGQGDSIDGADPLDDEARDAALAHFIECLDAVQFAAVWRQNLESGRIVAECLTPDLIGLPLAGVHALRHPRFYGGDQDLAEMLRLVPIDHVEVAVDRPTGMNACNERFLIGACRAVCAIDAFILIIHDEELRKRDDGRSFAANLVQQLPEIAA